MSACSDGSSRAQGNDSDTEGADETASGGDECLSDEAFFEQEVQVILQSNCQSCHYQGGDAQHTKFILQSPAASPDYLERNLAVFTEMAKLEFEGVPWIQLKPTGQMQHGGGPRFAVDSPEYAAFGEMIERLKNPTECPDEEGLADAFFEGVDMLDEVATLRKATLSLVGRLPTADELELVEADGMAGLDQVLDALMRETAFYERIKEIYNDHFLTRRYHSDNGEGAAALDLLQGEDYPTKNWYQNDPSAPENAERFSNDAVAQEPLLLLEYILRNDLPYTEIITADYTVVTPYSARVYGIEAEFDDPSNPNALAKAQIPGIPHAGVLTQTVYLTRFPTTRTNRNRHRSRMFQEFFLATDVQALGTRPSDATGSNYANPTMEDSNCVICHETVDPVAGTFADWTDLGAYRPPGHAQRGPNVDEEELLDVPPNNWYTDMRPPGFLDIEMPAEWNGVGLQWLAKQAVDDNRFATSAVYLLYTGLTGQKPLREPTDPTAGGFIEGVRAAKVQREVFNAIADEFRASNYDLRVVIKGLVKSPYYRAHNAQPLSEQRMLELADLGMGLLVSPEQLHRKIIATTGVAWGPLESPYLLDRDEFRILYGGIDSNEVTQRVREPSGTIANIAKRMANEVACASVAQDLARPSVDRLLFPYVEYNYGPGIGSPAALDSIRSNIQYLHEHLLGESLAMDDPEIERTYQIFIDVFDEGQRGLEAGEYAVALPQQCQATADYWSGEPFDIPITNDENYTVRAWIAVMSYLLTDYNFLHE